MDKAVLIFLKRIIKADKLLDKELFLKFTNREITMQMIMRKSPTL